MKPGNRPPEHAHESCILPGAWGIYPAWQAVFPAMIYFVEKFNFFR